MRQLRLRGYKSTKIDSVDEKAKRELGKYGYRWLMRTLFNRDRWQWKNEFFLDLSADGSWTGWSNSGGETKKGKGFRSLSKYLLNYHS